MARLRRTLTMLAFVSAITSRGAVAQGESSASLTHTVSVTVPPRVRVQLAPVASSVQRTASSTSGLTAGGLALRINATQSWTLSIGSAGREPQHQWSVDRDAGFATLSRSDATVASGVLSSTPSTTMVFFRRLTVGSGQQENSSSVSDAVLLTIVAP